MWGGWALWARLRLSSISNAVALTERWETRFWVFETLDTVLMAIFRARSSAKINLSLDILERLPNGYHTLRSLVHPVGLWDELELEFLDDTSQIVFHCDNEQLQGDDNLCVRAFKAWREATGFAGGASIRLQKNIPFGAGLGGGSGNAAAVLRMANARARSLRNGELSQIAAKLGADVSLFLSDSPVLMEGIGERLTPVSSLEGWIVLLKPHEGFATPAIYRAWDESGMQSHNGTQALLTAWQDAEVETVAPLLTNDLERAARLISPLPARCIELLDVAGAKGARLSGSGSACFGLCSSPAHAREVQRKIELELAKDVLLQGATTFVAPLVARGVALLP
ncbi:4-diphosphocytidyl-2-C-methyl-D-erythritol kinase [Abditibacteriota bacterium]|nr:4-diphosphocytidyl-2-C-methyl-D-erythritol kinase [Abditibacteriota bacterium]